MEVLLSLLVRSAAILVTGEILRRGLIRSAASQRHSIVFMALALLIGWPILSGILPAIPMIWPIAHRGATVTVTQTLRLGGSLGSSPATVNFPAALWLAGLAATLIPLLYGFVRVRQLARQAAPLPDDSWSELNAEYCRALGIARCPQLLQLSRPAMPMTCGILQPQILLPAGCLEWTHARKRAVLLHELAHVKRRDVLAQSVAQLATALWWFQPLSWLSRGNLRKESEAACDELVLAQGVRPSEYAAELLAMAKAFRAEAPWTAVPMAKRAGLEERVQSILRFQPGAHKSNRLIPAIACLSVLTLGASALTLYPEPSDLQQSSFQPQRSITMRSLPLGRSVLSGLLTSAGLSAAVIGGSLYDANGIPVANAKASISSPDTAMTQNIATAPDGKFEFPSLPAGHYILRIEKPGYAALYREFKVEGDSKVNRGLMLGNLEHAASRPEQLRIDRSVQENNLISRATPLYPESAKAAHLQGTVTLEAAISTEGIPTDIRVVSSPSEDMSTSALEAVQQWRYRPTLLNGEPIAVVTTILVHYTLSE